MTEPSKEQMELIYEKCPYLSKTGIEAYELGATTAFSIFDAELKARDERIAELEKLVNGEKEILSSMMSLKTAFENFKKDKQEITSLKEKLAKAVEALEFYSDGNYEYDNVAKRALTEIKSNGENKGAV